MLKVQEHSTKTLNYHFTQQKSILENTILRGEIKMSLAGKQLARSMPDYIVKEIALKKELNDTLSQWENMRLQGGHTRHMCTLLDIFVWCYQQKLCG